MGDELVYNSFEKGEWDMPYKRKGKKIYVKKDGKWKLLKNHKSKKDARAHIWMLRKKVDH